MLVPKVRSKVPTSTIKVCAGWAHISTLCRSKTDPSKIIELAVLLSSFYAKRFWLIETKRFRNGSLLLSQRFDNRIVERKLRAEDGNFMPNTSIHRD